jgi:hypothetical protein
MRALAPFGVILTVLSLVGCQTSEAHGPSGSPHFEIALDISRSLLAPCESGGGLALELMQNTAADRGSTLMVIVSGDARTLDEPVEVFRKEGFRRHRAMEAAVSSEKKIRAAAEDIVEKCREMPRTDVSPVALMIRRGIEHLRGLGCKVGTNCGLSVVTDGYDNVEPEVRRILADPRREVVIEPIIDNSGIAVSVYGLAETSGDGDRRQNGRIARRPHSVQSADRVMAVLRRLFTHPEIVTFRPHSPKLQVRPGGGAAVARAE